MYTLLPYWPFSTSENNKKLHLALEAVDSSRQEVRHGDLEIGGGDLQTLLRVGNNKCSVLVHCEELQFKVLDISSTPELGCRLEVKNINSINN